MGTGPDSNPGTTQFWGASKSKRKSDTVLWYTYCLKAKKSYMVVVVIEVVVVHSSSGKNT